MLPLLAELTELGRICSIAHPSDVATATSVQIVLFVAPLLCMSALVMGVDMDLNFGISQDVVLSANTWVFATITRHWECNAMEKGSGIQSVGLHLALP
jgi:Ca2+/H+ antiporter